MVTLAFPTTAARARRLLHGLLLAALATSSLALLVLTVDTLPVLTALAACAAGVALLIRPDLATLIVMLLLYVNVPAILTQRLGLPDVVAGSFVLLLGVPLVQILTLQRRQMKADLVFFCMIAYFGVLVLSSLWAVDRQIALGRVRGFVFEGLLLYWLTINVVRDLPTLRKVMATLLAGGALVSALCLYQEVTGSYSQDFGGLAYRNFDVLRDGDVRDQVGRGKYDRAQGPVNEPNRFAQILIVLVPMAVYLYRTTRVSFARHVAAAAGAMILIGIALTLSRGAIVALGLMAATMAWLRWVRRGRIVACAVGLLVVLPIVAPFYLDRVGSLVNVTHLVGGDRADYRDADGAMRGRLTEMLAAWYVFLDYPALGVGPGQFGPFYVERYSREPAIKFRQIQGARRAHTLYLEIAAETGLAGLLAFLAIAGVVLRRLWRLRAAWLGRDPARADLVTAFWLSLLAYLCTGVFLHLSYQRYYWLLLALATAALHVLGPATHPQARRAPIPIQGGVRWQQSR